MKNILRIVSLVASVVFGSQTLMADYNPDNVLQGQGIVVTSGSAQGPYTVSVNSLVSLINRQTFSNAGGAVTAGNNEIDQIGVMSGPITITLPAAASLTPGSRLQLVDISGTVTGTNTITVAKAGSDTINGSSSSQTISTAYGFLLLTTDGVSQWTVVGSSSGGGNVSNVGTPVNSQLAEWTSATTIQGFTTGTGILTFLSTPTSANLAAAMVDPTGSAGNLVFSAGPTFTGTVTGGGSSAYAFDAPNAGNSVFTSTGGGYYDYVTSVRLHNGVIDHSAGTGTTAGQYLKSDGSGNLNYANTTESYWVTLNLTSGTVAASTTYYIGTLSNSISSTEGRYKAYIPKSGKITTVIYSGYAAGGDGSHNMTAELYLTDSALSGTSVSFVSNAFPWYGGVTGLTQAVGGITASGGTISAGDYLELSLTGSSGMTSVTSCNFSCQVLIEVVTNNQ